jgi:hypothetical protein
VIVCGITLGDVPETSTPIEVIVIFKALNANGESCIYHRASAGLAIWDEIGLLTLVLDRKRDETKRGYDRDPGDETNE